MSEAMSKQVKTPADQPVRDRLVTEFDRNLLVEAGAGSGKTHSLAMRMAAGIEAGHYNVEHMAAVTFTRKAAAELRGRFQLALEDRIRAEPPVAARRRLETALAGIERLFAGTIHAFCAHLLRERPVDARMAPGFVELDDVENARQRQRAWRDYVAAARAGGFAPMLDLLDAGVKPKDLDAAFGVVCEHEDVTFDMGSGESPGGAAVWKAVDEFWKTLTALRPAEFHPKSTCAVQAKFDEFDGRLRLARRDRPSSLGWLLTFWGKPKVTQKYWGVEVGREAAVGKKVAALVDDFYAATVEPFLRQWRAYVHRLAMAVLIEARESFARDRRRLNVVNYVDLLSVTGTMLRDGADVRHALQQKYRWLFIDEFQDTDPIQAEIFLMLAADEVTAVTPCDRFTLSLRPGALFVVGDPKQSIFRFRRADIDIYNRVARRIVDTGGEVLPLTANFRSLPAVCHLANTVFPPLFAAYMQPYSPSFNPLDPVRDDSECPAGPRVAKLTVPDQGDNDATVEAEARLIAAYVHAEVASKRRTYGDFLVLTRLKPRLRVYAEAFDALEIPVEVSGSGLFCKSPEVKALALLLSALADPLDAVSLVGALRGPLFGISDPELFQYRQAGGQFELSAPLPEAADEKAEKALDANYGPVLPAIRRLREWWRLTRRLPLPAAIERMLEGTGWLALAATTPGGAHAGHLLQAIDEVRQVVESGGGLADAADALTQENESTESEALPLEPGQRDVVRLMNLHKAKGLEAPVVLLADPLHTYEFPIVLRVEREGTSAKGHLRLVRKRESGFGATTLAQTIDWDVHEAEEKKYVAAERLRLLYVAGTRAKELMVVCRVNDSKKNHAWDAFEGYLAGVPDLEVPVATLVAGKLVADLSANARTAADADRAARHDRLRVASWAVTTPTGEKARLAAADRARQIASDDEAAAAVPGTASHRADGGAAWGSLLHGLLEHAMRHRHATREDLARLAQWLTVETTDLRPFIPEALDWVDDVRRLPFWDDASASGERHVEVPFAVRVEESAVAQGSSPAVPAPTVLRGIIDLVHRCGVGWRILDYKSDQLDGLADVDAELLARYGPQLAQYRLAWERAAGGPVCSTELVALRAKRTITSP